MPSSKSSSRKALSIIVGGFSIVLLANFTLLYFALNTWTGLETEHYFAKGLAYNSNLEGARRQQELGWKVEFDIRFFPGPSVSGTSRIRFMDKDGAPMEDIDVRVLITRPILGGFDQELDFTHMGAGIYKGDFKLPMEGQWDFRILAQRGIESYQRVERIVTP